MLATMEPPKRRWTEALPVLSGSLAVLRELHASDALSLQTLFSAPEVARFVPPPPATVPGFERFVLALHRERAAGASACFAVVPHGMDDAIGIFQVRALEPGFRTAEWCFALGSPFWGTGMFPEGARLVLEFAFGTLGSRRLEARAAALNGRGNGALRKIGAVQEAVLRQSFFHDGPHQDVALWTVLDRDWRARGTQY